MTFFDAAAKLTNEYSIDRLLTLYRQTSNPDPCAHVIHRGQHVAKTLLI
jgi:hypothetical protein